MGVPETVDELRARLAGYLEEGSPDEAASAFLAWPAIDALLARLTAADERIAELTARSETAEADADRGWAWAERLSCWIARIGEPESAVMLGDFSDDLRLHDEALALRERPS